jgi:hypothetical protein
MEANRIAKQTTNPPVTEMWVIPEEDRKLPSE